MWRVALGLTIGIALGAAGAYVHLNEKAERRIASDLDFSSTLSLSPRADESRDVAVPAMGGFSERAAAYRFAAAAELGSVRAAIEEAAARPESADRRFLLATLLSRYAESSPQKAISLVDELGLHKSISAAVYGVWSGSDPGAALDAWRLVNDSAEAEAIGVAMFEALGADEQAFAILSFSPPPRVDVVAFQGEMIDAWAEYAPEAALEQAVGLDRGSARSRAVQEVAWAWSESDPRAALDALTGIHDPELRRTFRSTAIRGWSAVEPEQALEYLIEDGDNSGLTHHALIRIARADPQRALELAGNLQGQQARLGMQSALGAWAEDDVTSALAFVENLPLSQRRSKLQSAVARAYGKQQPEAAFAWAQSLEPPAPKVLEAVVGGIALTDPVGAVDALLTLESEELRRQAARSIAMHVGYSGKPQVLAERLVMLPDGETKRDAMRMLISNWASANPESALTWLLANDATAGMMNFSLVAKQLGHMDPATAVRYTTKVPPAYRQAWIEHVAGGYVQTDPAGALNWISQFQGQPAYGPALTQIIQHTAQHDPRGAARMFETIVDSPRAAHAAGSVANYWARQEPRAAAVWAQRLGDEQSRMSAISSVAREWVKADAPAVQRWALELQSAPDRDAALGSILPGIASEGTPDMSLLNALSSDVVRNEVMPQVIYHVATRDPDAARRMIDEHISDEHTRRQAERYLVAAQNR